MYKFNQLITLTNFNFITFFSQYFEQFHVNNINKTLIKKVNMSEFIIKLHKNAKKISIESWQVAWLFMQWSQASNNRNSSQSYWSWEITQISFDIFHLHFCHLFMGLMGHGLNNNKLHLLDTSWIFYHLALLYSNSSRLLFYQSLWEIKSSLSNVIIFLI